MVQLSPSALQFDGKIKYMFSKRDFFFFFFMVVVVMEDEVEQKKENQKGARNGTGLAGYADQNMYGHNTHKKGIGQVLKMNAAPRDNEAGRHFTYPHFPVTFWSVLHYHSFLLCTTTDP